MRFQRAAKLWKGCSVETGELRPLAQPTPMGMIALAVERGADLDQIQKLMDLQERWEAGVALKSYNKAFAAFKAEAVQIVRNIVVTDGPLKGKKYADLFAVVDTATQSLSLHGLSHSWKLTKDEPTWIEVGCYLRHVDGHFEVVTMGAPPDTGGAKNAVQARASTVSYLERYTFLAVTGLASSEGDKDGATIPTGAIMAHLDAIKAAPDLATLQEESNKAWKIFTGKADRALLLSAKDARKAVLTQETK